MTYLQQHRVVIREGMFCSLHMPIPQINFENPVRLILSCLTGKKYKEALFFSKELQIVNTRSGILA